MDFTRSPDKLLKLKIKLIVIETELSANKENYLMKKMMSLARLNPIQEKFYKYAKTKP